MVEDRPVPVTRPGVPADTPEVLRLAHLMYESMGIDASVGPWSQVAAEHISERLGQDAAVFVVDDPSENGRLAATGAGSISRRLPSPGNLGAKVGYVQWMSTDPAWRRRGFAREIMHALLEWFTQNEVQVVELHAAPLGERLYQELGFEQGKSPALRLRLEPAAAAPPGPSPSLGPGPSTGPPRQAARVVLLDEANAVLLLSGRDPAVKTAALYWILPGGGAHAGEALEDTARREVYEETGARLGELGPVVWQRYVSFPFDGRLFEQHESIFVVKTARFDVHPTALTELEVRSTTGSRWWSTDDLAMTKEAVYPPDLASLIAGWLIAGPPLAPEVIE
jgi:ADP-ribose pyrophosphatase YjhB (NUDIX family)/GNAT superfamily N-acetyltransferase